MTPQRARPPRRKVAPGKLPAGNISKWNHNTPPIDLLLPRLDRVRETGHGSWIARCPGHEDKGPSLSIKQVEDRLLIHCFAGCQTTDVLAAVGLAITDLFNRPLTLHGKPINQRQKRRYGQALDALKALTHECEVVQLAAFDTSYGLALSQVELERMDLAVSRIRTAQELCA